MQCIGFPVHYHCHLLPCTVLPTKMFKDYHPFDLWITNCGYVAGDERVLAPEPHCPPHRSASEEIPE